MPQISEQEKIKLHCNVCRGARWHIILYRAVKEHHEELDHPGHYYSEVCEYRLAECAGCENVTLYTEHSGSAYPEAVTSQWPPKVSRNQPKWFFELVFTEDFENPYKYDFINEIYVSLKNGNLRLAVLGIRALLEQIMIESVGDQRSFDANLKKFEAEGFISRLQKEAIAPVIEAGHASMHRGFKPTMDQVDAIMDVVENLVESIYITKSRTSQLNIPPRIKK